MGNLEARNGDGDTRFSLLTSSSHFLSITRPNSSRSTTATLRIIFALVCFEPATVVARGSPEFTLQIIILQSCVLSVLGQGILSSSSTRLSATHWPARTASSAGISFRRTHSTPCPSRRAWWRREGREGRKESRVLFMNLTTCNYQEPSGARHNIIGGSPGLYVSR
jgi:hypothetical protein